MVARRPKIYKKKGNISRTSKLGVNFSLLSSFPSTNKIFPVKARVVPTGIKVENLDIWLDGATMSKISVLHSKSIVVNQIEMQKKLVPIVISVCSNESFS